jgi:hypothetical protein
MPGTTPSTPPDVSAVDIFSAIKWLIAEYKAHGSAIGAVIAALAALIATGGADVLSWAGLLQALAVLLGGATAVGIVANQRAILKSMPPKP